MKLTNVLKSSIQLDEQSEFNKDIWDGRKLGADIRASDRITINFKTILPLWLRQAAKQYVRYTFATLSWATCKKRRDALNYFSSFLTDYHPGCLASDVERLLIIDFLSYLASRKLADKTRLNIIVDLDTFFALCSRNSWADLGDKVLIYKEDHPHLKKPLPRYIPPEVLSRWEGKFISK